MIKKIPLFLLFSLCLLPQIFYAMSPAQLDELEQEEWEEMKKWKEGHEATEWRI